MIRQIVSIIFVFIIGISVYICATMASDERLPASHPVDLSGQPPVCTECHETQEKGFPYAQYVHTSDFRIQHSSIARENKQVCTMCHQQTFCTDCHATRTDKTSAHRLPATHPVKLSGPPPVCAKCHETQEKGVPYARYNHTSDFGTRHRLTAFGNERTCKMCHQPTFCSDCHAARTELKPSTRFPDKTTRRFPHRGDYLSRHQVDGRLNPASCIRCHGTSATSQRCRRCHG
jgi:hypothetical protein